VATGRRCAGRAVAVEAQKVEPARWVRVLDFSAVDAAIGKFFAGERERVKREFEAGQAHVYEVRGPGYAGIVALRFERRVIDGALQCHVITARGENMHCGGMADLARISKRAGAVAITSDVSDISVLRMLARDGWELEDCRMKLGLTDE